MKKVEEEERFNLSFSSVTKMGLKVLFGNLLMGTLKILLNLDGIFLFL